MARQLGREDETEGPLPVSKLCPGLVVGLCPEGDVVVNEEIRMSDPCATDASFVAADGNEYVRGEDGLAVVVETGANDALDFDRCESKIASVWKVAGAVAFGGRDRQLDHGGA